MTNEQSAFIIFKFRLGQRVQHRIGELEGIIVQRKLVQDQHGHTGRCYTLSYGPEAYSDAAEIELEEVDGSEG